MKDGRLIAEPENVADAHAILALDKTELNKRADGEIGSLKCLECNGTFASKQGLGVHITRAHGIIPKHVEAVRHTRKQRGRPRALVAA